MPGNPKEKKYRRTDELPIEGVVGVLDKDFEAVWAIQEFPTGDPVLIDEFKDISKFFYWLGIQRGSVFIRDGE